MSIIQSIVLELVTVNIESSTINNKGTKKNKLISITIMQHLTITELMLKDKHREKEKGKRKE